MKKITPFLWFDNNAEEAMNFYCSVFKNSRAGSVNKLPDGKVLTVTFELEGQEFVGLNGGPQFKFNEAVSFSVDCNSQEEVDYYWNTLLANGGKESMCGWLKDQYSLWWQIVPSALSGLLANTDKEKAERAMNAMLQMKKLDINIIQKAFNGH